MYIAISILAGIASAVPTIEACELNGRTIHSDIKYCVYENGQTNCKIVRTKWIPLGDKILYYDGIKPDSGWVFYRERRVDITNDRYQHHPVVPGKRKYREIVESTENDDVIKLRYQIEVYGKRAGGKVLEIGFEQDTRLIDCASCEIVGYRFWTNGFGQYRDATQSSEFSSASCTIF